MSPERTPASPFPEQVVEWAALRTAARWEKKVAELLGANEVPVFLPLMTRLSLYAGKRRSVEVPLFGGYVFCSAGDFIDNKRISPAVRSKVAQLLRPPDPNKLRTELSNIAHLLTDRQLIQERVAGGVGDVVRIIGGPLVGYHGTILRTKPNRWQVVVDISFLGARREIEVDERMVERVV